MFELSLGLNLDVRIGLGIALVTAIMAWRKARANPNAPRRNDASEAIPGDEEEQARGGSVPCLPFHGSEVLRGHATGPATQASGRVTAADRQDVIDPRRRSACPPIRRRVFGWHIHKRVCG